MTRRELFGVFLVSPLFLKFGKILHGKKSIVISSHPIIKVKRIWRGGVSFPTISLTKKEAESFIEYLD